MLYKFKFLCNTYTLICDLYVYFHTRVLQLLIFLPKYYFVQLSNSKKSFDYELNIWKHLDLSISYY